MLHIHNGDCTANRLQESGLAGTHLAWREALIEGPTPHGLSPDEWLAQRARHLAAAYEQHPQVYERELRAQLTELAKFSEHAEAVLWFEHDLFCQTNLLFLLDWFAQQNLADTKLSLICINQFPGLDHFRGLGQLDPQQLASLFAARQEVTDRQFSLASQAWAAYSSPAPQAIENLLETDTSPLPFLQNALRLHLRRFPALRNGLGQIENGALELIGAGSKDFRSLFSAFANRLPDYGLGDYQFWNTLKRLILVAQPLLTVSGIDDLSIALNSGQVWNAVFALTPAGEEVLAKRADFITINGIDYWLGGVHLQSDSLWRWDEANEKLVS